MKRKFVSAAAIIAGTLACDNRAAATTWDETVAAARREGTVVVSALSGELLRQVLTSFEQDYPGIRVQYQSGNLRDLWPPVEKYAPVKLRAQQLARELIP